MKKIFTVIYLLCMVSTFSYAQNFRYGFTGGVNLSKPMGDIEPQCQAGLLLGAKGELGIPSVIKCFTPNSDYICLQKFINVLCNTSERRRKTLHRESQLFSCSCPYRI